MITAIYARKSTGVWPDRGLLGHGLLFENSLRLTVMGGSKTLFASSWKHVDFPSAWLRTTREVKKESN